MHIPLVALMLLAGCRSDVAEPSDPSAPDTAATSGASTSVAHTLSMDGDRPVDLLLIIDDSSSMVDDLDLLSDAFGSILMSVTASGVGWQLGVTTTDMRAGSRQGRLVPTPSGEAFLHPDHPDPMLAYVDLTVGEVDDGDEAGIEALYAALATHFDTDNAGFLRDEAALRAIVFADEDDQSGSMISVAEYADWLEALKADPSMVAFDAVVASPLGDAGSDTRYIDLAEDSGGRVLELADVPWQATEVYDWLIPPMPSVVLEPEPLPGTVTAQKVRNDTGGVILLEEGVDFVVVPGTGSATIEWIGVESRAGDTLVVDWVSAL